MSNISHINYKYNILPFIVLDDCYMYTVILLQQNEDPRYIPQLAGKMPSAGKKSRWASLIFMLLQAANAE
jgi:hypothetical protein